MRGHNRWAGRLAEALVAVVVVAAAGTLLPVGWVAPAWGEEATVDPAKRQAYDQAFKAMMADPGNLDKTFAYASLAVDVGDFDGAISALERMLLIDPNLPRVKLELGVLYYRVGSYQVAQNYLNDALASPNVPPEVTEKAERFLAEIDKRLARNRFSGSLYAGMRYQSNANAGPSGTNVRVFGVDATLSNQFTSKSDWNGFAAAQVKHEFDFQNQRGDTFESTALLYGTRQIEQTQVNLGYAELTTGPRFRFPTDGIGTLSVRPYGIIDFVSLDDIRYYWAPGAGANLNAIVSPETTGDLIFEYRDLRYRDTNKQPFNTDRNGRELRGQVGGTQVLFDIVQVGGYFGVIDEDAEVKSQINREYDGTVVLGVAYKPPLLPGELPWNTSLQATRAWINYREPDATIDPNVTRRDRDWRLSLSTSVPVTDQWGLNVTVARFMRDSTLPNFAYTNTSVAVGATFRF
jgi:Tetratricopeptide repeat